MQLAAAADEESVGRFGGFDAQAEVYLELPEEPCAELPGGRELALAAGERRGVDAEGHLHGRLVDCDPGQRVG